MRALREIGAEVGVSVRIVRDSGSHVRAVLPGLDPSIELDLVFDRAADLEPPGEPVEGIVVESLVDLRANKLTCLLSRAEPRDLVDVMFLDRAGFAPERDLALAVQKDSGIDPAILSWLLATFPVEPLPEMLVPLSPDELRRFRDDLSERFRRVAVP